MRVPGSEKHFIRNVTVGEVAARLETDRIEAVGG
jgi:hypothetical protein